MALAEHEIKLTLDPTAALAAISEISAAIDEAQAKMDRLVNALPHG